MIASAKKDYYPFKIQENSGNTRILSFQDVSHPRRSSDNLSESFVEFFADNLKLLEFAVNTDQLLLKSAQSWT